MEETLQHRDFRNPGQPSCAAASGADVSGATVWVSEAQLRNRQKPTDEDAGKWVTLSSNLILDGHLLIYAASSPTQTSLTNSQKSWSGFKQHFAAITAANVSSAASLGTLI